MLRLTIVKAPPDEVPEGSFYIVAPGGATIGRTKSNSWRLSDRQSLISRTHFEIELKDGKYCLTDRSTNGTYIDDELEPLGRGGCVPLSDGSVIRAGEYLLEARLEVSSTEPAPSLSSTPKFLENPVDPPASQPDETNSVGSTSADGGNMQPNNWPRDVASQPLPDDIFESPPSAQDPLISEAATAQTVDSDIPQWDTPPVQSQDAHVPQTPSPISQSPLKKQGEFPSMQSASPQGDSGASMIPDNWYEDPLVSESSAAPPEPAPDEMTPPPSQPPPTPISPPASSAEPPHPKASYTNGNNADSSDLESLRTVIARVLGPHAETMRQEEMLHVVGEMADILKLIVPPLMASMRARTQFKDQLRLHQTMIRAEGNNPLKFMDTPEKALEHILLNDQPGLLQGRHAMREAMEELAAHQGAMIAALGPALKEAIGQLSPETIQELSGSTALVGLAPRVKAKLWDNFVDIYNKLCEPGRYSLEQHFMTALADSYETILHAK